MPQTKDLIIYAIAFGSGFKSFDFRTNVWADVDLDSNRAGHAVIGIPSQDSILFCFTRNIQWDNKIDVGISLKLSTGVMTEFTWRFPCKFASSLGNECIAIGSTLCVDIISMSTGQTLHIFETAKDKIRSLNFLCSRFSKLYVSALEDREDYSNLVILIQTL